MKVLVTNLIIALTYAVNVINAAHFKVICAPFDHGGSGVNINIDGKTYPMESYNNDILYEYVYDGTPSNYYYEIAEVPDQSEIKLFGGNQRTWDPSATTTLYEVYGRQVTLGDDMIKTIPRIYKPLEGYDKFSQLFQEGELNVINVHMSDANYNELLSIATRKNIDLVNYIIEFELYTPYERYHFTNATISLSGQGSVNKNKKPFKIDLSPNEEDTSNSEIFKRKEFKLRNLYFDKTFIRNKLASDVAESLGLPVTQNSLCRLYINNKSYGLYELSDMYKKKFVKRFFNPPVDSEQKTIFGTLYKAVSSWACDHNFPAYLYPESDENMRNLYECIVEPSAGYDTHQDVNAFIKWLGELPDNASIQQIEEKLDLDMLLKDAVLEYTICHWDGFLGNGNNYFIYAEPNNGKYHVFSYDFDLTFGVYCDDYIKLGDFDTYVTSHDLDQSKEYNCQPPKVPQLYTKILKNPEVKKLLDDYIKEIVGKLMNSKALEKRIDYLYNFYKTDMYWDFFCRNNIIKTQFFEKPSSDELEPLTNNLIETEYNDESSRKVFKGFITQWIGGIANTYGVNLPQEPIIEGDYGSVGGKMMTLGSSDDGDKKDEKSSSAILSSNYSMSLLYTIVCIILVWIMD